MIRRTKYELGEIAAKMWRDAKTAGDSEGRTLMAQICKESLPVPHRATLTRTLVKADAASGHRMDENEIVAQMRTTISAGYETVSAVVAVRL